MKNKRFLILTVLTLIFAIFDYYMCDLIAYQFKFPLFCDMIFCMAMSFFAGPLWGIAVVCSNHLFDLIISNSFVIFHMYIVTAMTGCVIVWAYKKGFIDKHISPLKIIGHLVMLSLIMCLAMSISGGIVSRIIAYIFGEANNYTYQTDFIETILDGRIKSPLLDSIIVRIPVNFVDRIVTVFAAWGVYKIMKNCENKIKTNED